METALDNALKRKKELEDELARVNQFIQMYDQFSGMNLENPATPSLLDSAGRIVRATQKLKQRGRPADFARLIRAILSQSGHPMARGELISILEGGGHSIPSADKQRYIGTVLWRNRNDFINIKDKGYWLRNLPCPAIGYDPTNVKIGQEVHDLMAAGSEGSQAMED